MFHCASPDCWPREKRGREWHALSTCFIHWPGYRAWATFPYSPNPTSISYTSTVQDPLTPTPHDTQGLCLSTLPTNNNAERQSKAGRPPRTSALIDPKGEIKVHL